MVKNLITILAAVLIIISFGVLEQVMVRKQFGRVEGALITLYDKCLEESATREDGEAVRKLWQEEKRTLHVYIPHTDISYIDYWLDEAVSLIYTADYKDALSKIEVLKDICRHIPDTYKLNFENVL